ncbi:hypothetical protein [Mesonia mobilis]|uniref:Uncharacterized protein n=1 Tax=Mesonia mobilis TaxID=369791 RepID=A0ABQ3BKM4_9FLAO|nr:hypothetical protein [Mesonia mobilis]MBQ0737605.1 hypothetical protein [Aquimarina celericrescens]GGZ48935.1 hypothetical protein GCM10008088_07830 [Mesonia mobilis]
MSGFDLTVIVRNKKVSKTSNFFSDLNFYKKKKSNSLFNSEFSINNQFNEGGEEIFIYDNFYIQYNGEIENYGYPEHFWKKTIDKIYNPQCTVNISSMSRDFGSLYVILKHLEQLLLEDYQFYIISNNLNDEIKENFENSDNLLRIEKDEFLFSEKIFDYIIRNKISNFIGY